MLLFITHLLLPRTIKAGTIYNSAHAAEKFSLEAAGPLEKFSAPLSFFPGIPELYILCINSRENKKGGQYG